MDEVTIKFLTIGDASVGKTCISVRYTEDMFPLNAMPSIGVEYKSKQVQIGNRAVKVQIWDTAGQERYQKTIAATFYRRANVIVLVFDINDRQSFEHVKNWMFQIQQNADKNTTVALVGNKADLPHNVTYEEAASLAEEYQIPYYSVSALTGEKINSLFGSLTEECLKKIDVETRGNVLITDNPVRNISCCKL